MGYEDELLRQGFVPKGVRRKQLNASGEATWETGAQRAGTALNKVMDNVYGALEMRRKQEQQKAEAQAKQFDMYKTLRESGYDPKAAHEATLKKVGLPEPSGTDKFGREEEKTQAELGLTKAKTKYYEQGGAKRTVIDKMTPAQLQDRLKFLTDPVNVQEGDEEETTQEILSITKTLRGMTTGKKEASGTESPSEGFVIMKSPDGTKYKIPKANIEKAKQRGFTA